MFSLDVIRQGRFAIFGGLEQSLVHFEFTLWLVSDISDYRVRGILIENFWAYPKDFSFTGDVYTFKKVLSSILMNL